MTDYREISRPLAYAIGDGIYPLTSDQNGRDGQRIF